MLAEHIEPVECVDVDPNLAGPENEDEYPSKYGAKPTLPGLCLGRCTRAVMLDRHVRLHILFETVVVCSPVNLNGAVWILPVDWTDSADGGCPANGLRTRRDDTQTPEQP